MQTFILSDGRRLAFSETGEGPALVLLHGWAMSSAVFSEVADLLAEDFRVLVPDLRGHGHSDGADGYALDDFAGDLCDWLINLDEQVDLFGWSFGGQVALRVRQMEPALIRRLGLISSTPRFVATSDWSGGLPDAQVLAMLRQLKRQYLKAMGDFFDLQFAGEDLSRERYRRIVDFAVRQARLPEPDVAIETLQTLRGGNLCADLCRVNCPTLVMHGELDRVCPPGAGRALAGKIPDARLVMLSRTGHAPFLSEPSAVVRHWKAFLR